MDNYFSQRGSCRQYDDRRISTSLLDDILDRAMHAPNTGNMQLYSVIVTRDAESKQKLAPAHFNQPAVTSCDVLLTFCVDINRFSRWCLLRNADAGFDNFQAFTYAMIDAVIYAQQVVTIAEMEGLGTCYMGTTTYNAATIADVLQLPEGVVPVATVTLGYPAVEPKPSPRLPLKAIVHEERYHETTDSEIIDWYSVHENAPEAAKFIAENGKETLAQVFAEVRYTRRDNEFFSKALRDLIARQGFKFPG